MRLNGDGISIWWGIEMYLLDTNILRELGKHHPNLIVHLHLVHEDEIALPSIVVAEAIRGRCDFVLKASPDQMVAANQLLLETLIMLRDFNLIALDASSAAVMVQLMAKHKSRKRYADLMIAAMAIAGRHIVVTRNQKHFADLLPPTQLQNWIDDQPH